MAPQDSQLPGSCVQVKGASEARPDTCRAQPFWVAQQGGLGGQDSLPRDLLPLQSHHSKPTTPYTRMLKDHPQGSGDSSGDAIQALMQRNSSSKGAGLTSSTRQDSFEEMARQMEQQGGSMYVKKPFSFVSGQGLGAGREESGSQASGLKSRLSSNAHARDTGAGHLAAGMATGSNADHR